MRAAATVATALLHTHRDHVLDHGVAEKCFGGMLNRCKHLIRYFTMHLELKALALANRTEARDAEALERRTDGLSLRIENFGLGHHVHDDLGHRLSLALAPMHPKVPDGLSADPVVLNLRRGQPRRQLFGVRLPVRDVAGVLNQ